MKQKMLLIPIFVLLNLWIVNAQDNAINTGFGFGTQLVQYQNDFGVGLQVTSPYFANNRIGLRLKANWMWNESVLNGITEWTPYSNISLGIIGVGGFIGDRIRLYGEGGVILINPSEDFSSESKEFGGYGVFGFEFFFAKEGNYFIEIGGMGSGARADKADFQPIYSNGMTISVGVRGSLR